jgi:hypothetical protein
MSDMNVYWYISKAKLDLLRDQAPGFLNGISAKVSFKFPFVGGSLSGTEKSKLVDDLKRVISRIESKSVKDYAELNDQEAPVFFRFEGAAASHVIDEVYWLAMAGGDTALLLAGSATYVIGAPRGSEVTLSPSVDPIGAVRAVFEKGAGASDPQQFGGTSAPLSTSLSYAWQELMRDQYESGQVLPRAAGLAIFGTTIRADAGQMRRVGRETLSRIVVGTPIYVKQV